jgi:uncharacterized protein (DUF697 family)
MKLPVDVRALYDASKQLSEEREHPVRLAVLVEVDAPDALVEAARDALVPLAATGVVDVAVIEPDQMLRVDSRADAAIVLAGGVAHLRATLDDLRARAIPTAVLAVREDGSSLHSLLGRPQGDVLVGLDAAELFPGPLADWLMARLDKKHAALAHNFSFVRRAVAKEAVKRCAWQNAAIGAVMFIPGADMPLMTLNQGRMLLQIAAAYGQPLDRERLKELAAVVAGGFAFRTVAREVVGLVPGFGWAIKGGIAYSGTIAMGTAAIGYFEKGADLPSVVRALTERAGDAYARAGHALTQKSGAGSVRAASDPSFGMYTVTEPGGESADGGAAADPTQPTLIDVPPVRPTLVVLDPPDGRGPKTGPAL